MKRRWLPLTAVCLEVSGLAASTSRTHHLAYEATIPQLAFAAGEIRQALDATPSLPAPLAVRLETDPKQLGPQAYRIERGAACRLCVIGVMGVGGATAAPASLPEFPGNAVAVPTAPFWSEELGAIDKKHEKVRQIRYFLDSKHKDHPNADGKMTEAQKREHLKKFEADLILPAEAALWKRGASNAGYHYLGCAQTFALMGKAFAEANLEMRKEQRGR